MTGLAGQKGLRQELAPRDGDLVFGRALVEARADDVRIAVDRRTDHLVLPARQPGDGGRSLQGGELRRHADDLEVDRFARCQIALGSDPLCGGARQPRFRLRHVRAGQLADVETVLGRLQLPCQDLFVVDVELEHRLVAPHVHVGRDRGQKDVLLDGLQARALRLNVRLGACHAGDGAAAAIERLLDVQQDLPRDWSSPCSARSARYRFVRRRLVRRRRRWADSSTVPGEPAR